MHVRASTRKHARGMFACSGAPANYPNNPNQVRLRAAADREEREQIRSEVALPYALSSSLINDLMISLIYDLFLEIFM